MKVKAKTITYVKFTTSTMQVRKIVQRVRDIRVDDIESPGGYKHIIQYWPKVTPSNSTKHFSGHST
ncbi:hypothetical protein, partial [Raoultella lignicola]